MRSDPDRPGTQFVFCLCDLSVFRSRPPTVLRPRGAPLPVKGGGAPTGATAVRRARAKRCQPARPVAASKRKAANVARPHGRGRKGKGGQGVARVPDTGAAGEGSLLSRPGPRRGRTGRFPGARSGDNAARGQAGTRPVSPRSQSSPAPASGSPRGVRPGPATLAAGARPTPTETCTSPARGATAASGPGTGRRSSTRTTRGCRRRPGHSPGSGSVRAGPWVRAGLHPESHPLRRRGWIARSGLAD